MWFNKPQFFTYYDGIFFRTDPGLGQVPFTGEMFGVYLFPNSDTNANLQQEVNAWQSRGVPRSYSRKDLPQRWAGAAPVCSQNLSPFLGMIVRWFHPAAGIGGKRLLEIYGTGGTSIGGTLIQTGNSENTCPLPAPGSDHR
jgi:hypothetical protein